MPCRRKWGCLIHGAIRSPITLPDRSIVRVLRHVATFKTLRLSELGFIASAGLTILYQAGDIILEQGEKGYRTTQQQKNKPSTFHPRP